MKRKYNKSCTFSFEIYYIVFDKPKKSKHMTISQIWDSLLDGQFFTLEELNLVTDINGLSVKTLDDMCKVRYGVDHEELLGDEE